MIKIQMTYDVGETMTLKEVRELHNGDEVRFRDPDPESSYDRVYKIQKIEIKGEVICITDQSGDYLECFAHELY